MADGPQIDRGAELFARGVGQNANAGAEQLKPNEQETPELVVQGANQLFGNSLVKFVEAVPLVGSLLAGMIPTNPGRASMFGGLETEGYAGKTINPGKGGTQGSNLYNALIAPLIANRAVTDQTGGTGGDGDIMASGGGGNGFETFSSMPGMESFISATSNRMEFAYSDVPMSALGTFSPPVFGDAAAARGEGFGIA